MVVKKRRSSFLLVGTAGLAWPAVSAAAQDVTPPATPASAAAQPTGPDLSGLSIEELAQLPVRSASKRQEPLSQAPTALFVITGEEGAPLLGGIYHALMGTLLITVLATLISVPVGLLTAIYLVEYGEDRSLARAITFFVDVMTGIPSIVAGLFAAAAFFALVGPGTKTGAVAAVALSVLMIPVVVRSSEEMLKIVPNELREAAYALGVRKWRTILKVVLPTAISGIASGITLAIARVIGETAPILVTAGFATTINTNVFSGWMASLPTFIYTQILNPTSPSNPDPSSERAWGAALVLIILVMLLNLGARLIARIFAPKTGR